ncbi:MAG: type III secretion protein [Proteus mirabilis]|nr:type III secretion protein [Proteus mirabilis]HEK0657159.1 type III secretion protein [Proteus mirabilis]HEK2072783.1 type III secretion protein [Proteus mirabilis]
MNMKINSDNVSNNYRTTINNSEENESVIDKNKLYKDIEPSLSKLTGIERINLKPILSEPENITKPDIKQILDSLEVDNDNDIYDHAKIEKMGIFNFVSDDMIKLIDLIVKYLETMIKKFEASREMSVMLMNIELDIADKVKDNLNKKANIMIGSAITSAGISMAIHGMGATFSIKGMGKDLIGNSNPTMVVGNTISAVADPLARVADQSMQSESNTIEGEQKVLDARGSINNNVINNNNEIQREVTEVIKALLQTIEAIIHAQQDAASTISSNVRA